MKRLAPALLALVLGTTACIGGTASPGPTPTDPDQPPPVELLAVNVRVLPGTGDAVRIGFDAFENAARVIITHDSASIVAVCGLAAVDDAIPSLDARGCIKELPSGVRNEIVRPQGLAGLAVWVAAGDPIDADIRIEYAEGSRTVSLRLPRIPAPTNPRACADNACNPFFEMRPVRDGRFRATATWTGGAAHLVLLQGRVLARSQTATGIPYRIADEATGAAPLTVEARMGAPGEYALAIEHTSGNRSDLVGITIDATWP